MSLNFVLFFRIKQCEHLYGMFPYQTLEQSTVGIYVEGKKR